MPASAEQGTCNECSRPGRLYMDEMVPATPHLGIMEPWRFRYYLCRWHWAVWTRRKNATAKRRSTA